MSKIKESINTMASAKKHGRTYEQQKYRNDLAKNLKEMRKCGETGHDLSKSHLEKEMYTRQYLESLGDDRKLGMDVAMELIRRGDGKVVADFSDKIKGLDYEVIAKEFVKRGDRNGLLNFIDSDKGFRLNYKIVEDFFGGYICSDMFLRNLNKFKGVDYKKIAENLIKYNGWRGKIISYLNKCDDFDYNELAEFLIDKYPIRLFCNIEQFGLLNQNNIVKLFHTLINEDLKIEPNTLTDILEKIDMFHEQGGLNYSEILKSIINYNHRLVKGHGKDRHDKSYKIFNKFLSKFKGGLFDISVAKELIQPNKYYYSVASHVYGEPYYYKANESFGEIVYKNINKFNPTDHKDIAINLIENGYKIEDLLKYLDDFKGLDEEIAKKLIDAGYGDYVVKHPGKFGLKK